MRNLSRSRWIAGMWAGLVGLVLTGCAGKPAPTSAPGAAAEAAPQAQTENRWLTTVWTTAGAFEHVKYAVLFPDMLLVTGAPRGVNALNLGDGTLKWVHEGRRVVDKRPTLRKDQVYLVEGGQFVVLDAVAGVELSRSATRAGATSPLYVGDNTWMVCGGGDYVYGIRPDSGFRSWRSRVDDVIVESTWDGSERVFMVSRGGILYGFSIDTHEPIWEYRFSQPFTGAPTFAGDTLYIGSSNFYFHAIDAASGALKWRVTLGAPVLGTPTVSHGRVYVSTSEGVLYAVDLQTHQIVWKSPGARRVLTASEKELVVSRPQEELGILDAATGECLAVIPARGYTHYAADAESGVFYAVARSGSVAKMALKSATPAP